MQPFLCDCQIRKQAMKDLPQLCKGCPEHVPRIANILTQLLQSEDLGEISLIQSGLLSLFRIDAKGIVTICGQPFFIFR